MVSIMGRGILKRKIPRPRTSLLHLSVCLSVCVSTCLTVCLPVHLFVHPLICQSVGASFQLSVCSFFRLSVRPSTYLSILPSVRHTCGEQFCVRNITRSKKLRKSSMKILTEDETNLKKWEI